MAEVSLLNAFRFRVFMTPSVGFKGPQLTQGGFQECTGLDIELDIAEHLEGGFNNRVVRRVGRAKFSPVVLKRGLLRPKGGKVDSQLWDWGRQITSGGKVVRYDGFVELWDSVHNDGTTDAAVAATWLFRRALPLKLVGPQLNAKDGGIAMEELHLAIESLELTRGSAR